MCPSLLPRPTIITSLSVIVFCRPSFPHPFVVCSAPVAWPVTRYLSHLVNHGATPSSLDVNGFSCGRGGRQAGRLPLVYAALPIFCTSNALANSAGHSPTVLAVFQVDLGGRLFSFASLSYLLHAVPFFPILAPYYIILPLSCASTCLSSWGFATASALSTAPLRLFDLRFLFSAQTSSSGYLPFFWGAAYRAGCRVRIACVSPSISFLFTLRPGPFVLP